MAILPLAHNYNLASPGMLGTFWHAGTVVLAPSADADEIFALVARERVTVMAAVVPLIAAWLASDIEKRHDLSSLKVVQNGGARLAPELRGRLRERFGCIPQEIYGTAEGLINMTRLDDPDALLLVATARRVFAISPLDAQGFVRTFARSVEMGSLTPAEAQSVYPTFIVARAWDSPLARYLWLTALFLNLGLLAWVGLLIPSMPQVMLDANAGGASPSTQLILLPLASTLLGISGWLAGLSFYRWERQRPLAFVVWLSGALSGLAFLIAVLFIISRPI
jgi:acyl-CoA synthetase (AMP-forming)/AMP-acid ligase II